MAKIDEALQGTGKFLTILANESQPVDQHCNCGCVLPDPWRVRCEYCELPD